MPALPSGPAIALAHSSSPCPLAIAVATDGSSEYFRPKQPHSPPVAVATQVWSRGNFLICWIGCHCVGSV